MCLFQYVSLRLPCSEVFCTYKGIFRLLFFWFRHNLFLWVENVVFLSFPGLKIALFYLEALDCVILIGNRLRSFPYQSPLSNWKDMGYAFISLNLEFGLVIRPVKTCGDIGEGRAWAELTIADKLGVCRREHKVPDLAGYQRRSKLCSRTSDYLLLISLEQM